MKSPFGKTLLALAAGLLVAFTAHAEEAKATAGPNKGKLIGTSPDLAEVVIGDDGILSVTFLDSDNKPVAKGSRSAAVFAQLESGRQPVEMVAKDESLVSAAPLPKPDGYIIVVQYRASADAKPTNTRINYAMHNCGGCNLKEYACTCTTH